MKDFLINLYEKDREKTRFKRVGKDPSSVKYSCKYCGRPVTLGEAGNSYRYCKRHKENIYRQRDKYKKIKKERRREQLEQRVASRKSKKEKA